MEVWDALESGGWGGLEEGRGRQFVGMGNGVGVGLVWGKGEGEEGGGRRNWV